MCRRVWGERVSRRAHPRSSSQRAAERTAAIAGRRGLLPGRVLKSGKSTVKIGRAARAPVASVRGRQALTVRPRNRPSDRAQWSWSPDPASCRPRRSSGPSGFSRHPMRWMIRTRASSCTRSGRASQPCSVAAEAPGAPASRAAGITGCATVNCPTVHWTIRNRASVQVTLATLRLRSRIRKHRRDSGRELRRQYLELIVEAVVWLCNQLDYAFAAYWSIATGDLSRGTISHPRCRRPRLGARDPRSPVSVERE